MPTPHRGVQAYTTVGTETGVAAATPHKLVVMLFDGALTAVTGARAAMQRGEAAQKGVLIGKAVSIIDEGLKASLDVDAGGELAQNLRALYAYMSQQLLLANLKNDQKALEEVGKLLTDLRAAWDTIGQVKPVTPPPAPSPDMQRSAVSYGKA
jgi:flagellar protein FliS